MVITVASTKEEVQHLLGCNGHQWKQFLVSIKISVSQRPLLSLIPKSITRDEADALIFGGDRYWADIGFSFED
ncbi:hypothetical protein M501DRAFT_999915 [Patellaria atrata CBS 101060]|uniref:Uncharacterized protein n=1 Tax=Patellaria atrata CBS 101060 TaxID=1346257 RepID=A0A9P4S237_9PEZI|nr:hypothetical protein M501DRAFT_999915 [Patellaria atrata CBS 101060]